MVRIFLLHVCAAGGFDARAAHLDTGVDLLPPLMKTQGSGHAANAPTSTKAASVRAVFAARRGPALCFLVAQPHNGVVIFALWLMMIRQGVVQLVEQVCVACGVGRGHDIVTGWHWQTEGPGSAHDARR